MTASRELLLAGAKPPRERVDLPEFGEDAFVWVHGMTAREKNDHDVSLLNAKLTGVDRKKAAIQKQLMLVACVRDENGNRLFTPDDIETLGNWPADVFNRVFDVAERLSGGLSDRRNEKTVKN